MREVYNLDFCFKGNRTYVHGTDIFNKTLDLFTTQLGYKEIKNIDISFHHIATQNLTFLSDYTGDGNDLKVTIKFKEGDNTHRFFAVENGIDVNCRYEYPEENIVQASVFDLPKNQVTLQKPLDFSFIEKIVAMNKGLLEKLFDAVDGKWYFTRLQHNDAMTDNASTGKISLTFKSNFNFKLTKTAVTVDDKEIGFIYFSLVKKG